MVVRQFSLLVVIGLVVGMVATWATSRVIASMLFGVLRSDAAIYVAVALGLAAVTLIACWLPARRAAKVDPVMAHRCE